MSHNIQFIKKDKDAITPTRAHDDDIGLDLTAIKIHKVLDNGVILYDTGICICPPKGYYVEIVPRSSIIKTGWILANNIGIIDENYRGNLYIPMVRAVPNAPMLELPFCKFQIIVRKAYYLNMLEVDDLIETERGDGGFGSSGERIS